MELFLAQNHSAMTHLPIAAAILAVLGAAARLLTSRKEVIFAWAALSIAACVSVVPTLTTGLYAARGRFNEDGKPYLESGLFVGAGVANARVRSHELLGTAGSAVALVSAFLGVISLRGGRTNKYLSLFLGLAMTLLWAIGGHLGGKELWGPDTFPALK
jgi:uncharacterized membrane protein